MVKQKPVAAIGVKIGKIPKSQGNMIPKQPNNSRKPNIRIGIIEMSGFRCPFSTCVFLLPVIFP